MEVLYELLVNFDNLKKNGIDLTKELEKQGWGNYFKRLYGPVYTFLMKEFWRLADCDDHYIISYVLEVKMVITEKSIVKLLCMETMGEEVFTTSTLGKNICPRKSSLQYAIRTHKGKLPRTRNFTRI